MLHDDLLDLRTLDETLTDLESRQNEFEDAESDGEDHEVEALDDDEVEELEALQELLSEIKGYGPASLADAAYFGDPTLIADDYFTSYAQDMAEDLGCLSGDLSWPLNHIDWEAAANELRQDYNEVTFDGHTYLWRSS